MLAGIVASALLLALYGRIERPWHILGWIALVPWLAVLDGTRSLRGAVLAGAAMAMAFVLVVFGWFASAIRAYTGASAATAMLVLVVLAPLLELEFLTFAVARHVVRRSGAAHALVVLAGASVWVATEWVTGKLFGDTLGHGLYPSPWLRQAADIAGVGGLTMALIAGNECVRAALVSRRVAPAATLAVLVATLVGYGVVRERAIRAADAEPPLTAGIVQANIAQYDRLRAYLGTYEAVRRILVVHFGMSWLLLARGRLDVLLWPETVYPTTFGSPKSEAGAAFDRDIAGFVAGAGVPLVFGAYDLDGGDEFNAAIFLPSAPADPPAFTVYRKASLFPLTERVPAWLESGIVRRWLPWLGTWKPGTGGDVVPVTLPDGRTVRVAPLICYDALAPRYPLAAVRRGAELIVTLSNDSWFDAGPGPHLHLVGAAFRSIETRRPQIRATNTGISAVIDATGEITQTIDIHRRDTLLATVRPVRTTRTLLLDWGDWLGPTALALGMLVVGGALVRTRRGASNERNDRRAIAGAASFPRGSRAPR
ncbi:MAG TPA: apolipoprotein N-acyltransferase [Candidatus Binatia bacterium]|nr:apolipoprotein N-acyltransferase [Candidatus Binatia bacterium]